MLISMISNLGQGFAEGHHSIELDLIAKTLPLRMIDVLLSRLVIAANRLYVSVLKRRNPDLLPSWRDN